MSTAPLVVIQSKLEISRANLADLHAELEACTNPVVRDVICYEIAILSGFVDRLERKLTHLKETKSESNPVLPD